MNPATGECIGVLPHASKADLDRALDAAEQAYPFGAARRRRIAAKILKRAADLMRERGEHIARIATLEEGKTIHEARLEIPFSADILEWFAEEGRRAYGRVLPQRAPGVRMTVCASRWVPWPPSRRGIFPSAIRAASWARRWRRDVPAS
jgi:succinate-semialdehyde dehydrogenase/glutarate-semialdehyde dehydrogenase